MTHGWLYTTLHGLINWQPDPALLALVEVAGVVGPMLIVLAIGAEKRFHAYPALHRPAPGRSHPAVPTPEWPPADVEEVDPDPTVSIEVGPAPLLHQTGALPISRIRSASRVRASVTVGGEPS